MAFALVLAAVLMALTAMLGFTSGSQAKRRLGAKRWKSIQRWAYLFYALAYAHLMLVLAPSVEQGVAAAQVTAAVYTVVFAAYAVLRIRRFVIDARPFSFAMAHSGGIPIAGVPPHVCLCCSTGLASRPQTQGALFPDGQKKCSKLR